MKKDILLENVPKGAKGRVLKDKTKFSEDFYKGNEKVEYSRLQFTRIYRGYDFMENWMFVRAYIKIEYGIDYRLLDQLLYLTPKNIFTLQDFWELGSLAYSYKRIDFLLKEGYVAVAAKGTNKQEHIYTATAKARRIIQEVHEMLSGEVPIPNNLLKRSPYKTDKTKATIIDRINKKEKPKTVKELWARTKLFS